MLTLSDVGAVPPLEIMGTNLALWQENGVNVTGPSNRAVPAVGLIAQSTTVERLVATIKSRLALANEPRISPAGSLRYSSRMRL